MKLLSKPKAVMQFLIALATTAILTSSCNTNELDIDKETSFEVTTMPTVKELAIGEMAEIRINVKRTGTYFNSPYYIRYFQNEEKAGCSSSILKHTSQMTLMCYMVIRFAYIIPPNLLMHIILIYGSPIIPAKKSN